MAAAKEDVGSKLELSTLFGSELLAKRNGEVVKGDLSMLDGKHVGIYFSAHWCPPCRQFTPMLRKTYLMMQALGKPFEVVFVSHDQSEQEFEDYYKSMPWLALPFKESMRRSGLARRFSVNGIPALVIISPEGQVLTSNARAALIKDPEGANFPWAGDEQRSATSLLPLLIMVLLAWLITQVMWPKSA